MNRLKHFAVACLLFVWTALGFSQYTEKKVLTIEGAKKVAAAAVAEAKKNNVGGAYAVVDDGGNLLYVERLDGTFAAAANVSIGKARTAAIFKIPTSKFEKIIRDGRTPMVALNDFTPLQGGVPIVVDGQVVGAIGVSGAASAKQDEELAIVGAEAAQTFMSSTNGAASDVFYLASPKVKAAFEKGAPLIEVKDYKVHASHRDAGSGQAEIHAWETDVIYVLEGTATFVTGGKVIDGKTTAPGEIRGAAIDGGETRKISPGDVVIVPKGTPHWFKEVNSKINYYVVKVIS